MAFLRQIRLEIRNILKSRFLLIIGILVIAVGVLLPVIEVIVDRTRENRYNHMILDRGMSSMVIGGYGYEMGYDEEPIIVDGITIESNSPLYWYLYDLKYEREAIEGDRERFSDQEILKLALEVMDREEEFYLNLAKEISDPKDYRADLVWSSKDMIYEKFIYEHRDTPEENVFEAIGYKMGFDLEVFKQKYIDIPEEEKLANLEKIDGDLDALYKIVESSDFPQYIELKLKQERDRIEDIQGQIALQEELIIKNPAQEPSINDYIESLKRDIYLIEENSIPTLEYRLEKNIIPNDGTWQNSALINIEDNQIQIAHNEILTEENFKKDRYLIDQYKTYLKYEAAMQSKINGYNNEILIAQRSLDADKPDMKYVLDGARYKTVGFLGYSIFVALYAVLLGGWVIASEFQQGTIRLLLIRPKTRTKILMAKFLGALVLTVGLYLAGSLLNLLTNGILYGFSDLAYPNYTISGEVGFFAYYVPKLLACTIPIIFGYTTAFMLSVLVKNTAVAIIIPVVCFIGSSIAIDMFAFSNKLDWLAYTPIPFVQMPSFFSRYSSIKYAIERGVNLSLPYGVSLLLILSAMCVVISIFTFKSRDITN